MASGIREEVWSLDDDPQRARTAFPDRPPEVGPLWARTVWASGVAVLQWTARSPDARHDPEDSFSRHLALNPFGPSSERSLYEAAAVLGEYVRTGRRARAVLRRTYPVRPDVEAVLWESRGAMIWHHQVERLAALSGLADPDASQLRRDLAKRMATAWRYAEELDVASGLSLATVLRERSDSEGALSVGLMVREARALRDALCAGV